MTKIKEFKPMLASQVDVLADIKYPVYVSPKLDGIRAVIRNGVALSRSLKPIPNKSIQEWAKQNAQALENVDGEFIVGKPTAENVFRETTSFVMSHDKAQDFSFYAFDIVSEGGFEDRLKALESRILPSNTSVLPQVLVHSAEALEALRKQYVDQGYEGAMTKKPDGEYKFGRSSLKEGLLLKLKLFKDEEFEIVGFDCKYHNANEAKINELGRTSRSTAQAGMIPLDTLGVLYLKTKTSVEFGCGSGFDDEARDALWAIRDTLIGKFAAVKFFDLGGYDVPRFPVFKGIRDLMDFKE